MERYTILPKYKHIIVITGQCCTVQEWTLSVNFVELVVPCHRQNTVISHLLLTGIPRSLSMQETFTFHFWCELLCSGYLQQKLPQKDPPTRFLPIGHSLPVPHWLWSLCIHVLTKLILFGLSGHHFLLSRSPLIPLPNVLI